MTGAEWSSEATREVAKNMLKPTITAIVPSYQWLTLRMIWLGPVETPEPCLSPQHLQTDFLCGGYVEVERKCPPRGLRSELFDIGGSFVGGTITSTRI